MKRNGFTIIELLVTIATAMFLLAVVIFNFSKVEQMFSLSRAVLNLEQDLIFAREMSLAAVPYRDALGNEQKIDGYGIYINPYGLADNRYVVYADKNPGNKKYDESDYIIKAVNFGTEEPGVKIKEIKNVSLGWVSINFSFMKTETTITQLKEGQNGAEIVFTLRSDSANVKSVLVNNLGLIEVK